MKPLISYRTADPATIQIVNAYWSITADGQWESTVASLRDRFGLKPSALARLVQDSGSLFDLDRRCTAHGCNNPFEYTSRTAMADRDRSFGDFAGLCNQCVVERVEQQKREEEDKRRKAREFAQSIWLQVTAIDDPFDYATLSLEEAAHAYSLFTIHQIFNNGDMRFLNSQSVVPGKKNDVEACTALYRQGFLRIGKETPLDAFASTNTNGEYQYFPDRIAWRFPMPSATGQIRDIGKALRDQLDRFGREGTSSPAVKSLWWSIAVEDAYAHLNRVGSEYRWSIARGIALENAICSALQKFSIPEVRSLIWRSVRDAAAQAQKTGVIRAQAINSIPGRLARMSDRYAANKWDIGSYVMNWAEDEPVLITVFFDSILKTGVAGFRDTTGATFG